METGKTFNFWLYFLGNAALCEGWAFVGSMPFMIGLHAGAVVFIGLVEIRKSLNE